MSTLKETLQQRRTTEPPTNISDGPADSVVRTLQIDSWNGEKWVFPWSHFSAARLQNNGKSEQLLLLFADHEVVLDGSRLVLLLPGIASLHLDSLRSLPAKYELQRNASEPFIERVSVRPVGGFAPEKTAPFR